MKKLYISPVAKALNLENEEFIAHSKEMDGKFPNGDDVETGEHTDDPDNPVFGDVKKQLWDEEW